MVSALVFSLVVSGGEFDFYAYGPYSDLVPRPETILGYGPGERHTTFRRQEQVMSAIAETARGRVQVFNYGESTEGRPLRIMVFGSPKNIARLEHIRLEIAAIASGDVAPDDIPEDLPTIVWINECIHGNETASFESAMWLAYTLAASRSTQITKMLDDALIIVNPVYNPDGHERFVVWYNSVSIGHQDPQAVEHAEAALHLCGEIDVTGSVDNVDLVAVPLGVGGCGADGYPALAFERHEVHHGGAFIDIADFVGLAGEKQDAFRHRGLPGVDVGYEAYVPNFSKVGFPGRYCGHPGCYPFRPRGEPSGRFCG